jgi:nitrile hydratase accessory protein
LNAPDPLALPGLPRDAEGPVFAEPWQAQAFALTLRLHAEGAFSWTEWAAALSDELARNPDPCGAHYYNHWVSALETVIMQRGLIDADTLATRKHAWAEAYHRTPHGRPVELDPDGVIPSGRDPDRA